jgi:hypothetical protein
VSLWPCEALFQLLRDAVVLCARLIDRFVHRSSRNIVVVVACSAVVAVNVDPSLRWSSGSVIDSSMIGVSSWVFLGHLFSRYRPYFISITPPSHRVRRVHHGRYHAHFMPQLM